MENSVELIYLPCVLCAKLLQSCPTLCDPVDGSLPGSSIHGILQARILERGLPFPFPGISLTQGREYMLAHLPSLHIRNAVSLSSHHSYFCYLLPFSLQLLSTQYSVSQSHEFRGLYKNSRVGPVWESVSLTCK